MFRSGQTASRDDEAVRRRRDQTRTLLFADCRNPFEDVAIAARMRQVLHTHQGRDKLFKCIMYFLRIYMWVKNIKLNFNFIEGASEENFTLVERNYMTIMNSRRLFRLGRFVGEWVRIQVTLLKSAQLIYAPSRSRALSYFVQLQMVLDVLARVLLCAKCMGDDLAYISQKGFLHSSVAGKLLYVGARLAVPVMTSDLFLNSLNLAQRILDSRHVVTVRENPPEYALEYGNNDDDGGDCEYDEYADGAEREGDGAHHAPLAAGGDGASSLALLGSASSNHGANPAAATLLGAANPYASFETLPKASVDDLADLTAAHCGSGNSHTGSPSNNNVAGGGALRPTVGSMRNLRAAAAAAGIDSSCATAFVASRDGHSGGVTVGTILGSPNNNNNNTSSSSPQRPTSHDSVALAASISGTPVVGGGGEKSLLYPFPTGAQQQQQQQQQVGGAAAARASHAHYIDNAAYATGPQQRLRHQPQQQGQAAGKGILKRNSSGGGMRKSKSVGAFAGGEGGGGYGYGFGSPSGRAGGPSAVVVSAALVEDAERARVGRSFSLLYTLNDLDRKRKGIQQEQLEQQQSGGAPVPSSGSAAAGASASASAAHHPYSMAAINSPPSGITGGIASPHHHHHHHSTADYSGMQQQPSGGAFMLADDSDVDATTPRHANSRGGAGGSSDSPMQSHAAGPQQQQQPYRHKRTLSSTAHTPMGLRPVVVGGGNLTNYVHSLYHPPIDPNNSDERDAVMKAAEATDLLDILSKNDGEEATTASAVGFSLRRAAAAVAAAAASASASAAGGGGRHHHHHHHHHSSLHTGELGELAHELSGGADAMSRGGLTEGQIVDGAITAPREQRLKALATSIAAQRRLSREQREAMATAVPQQTQPPQQSPTVGATYVDDDGHLVVSGAAADASTASGGLPPRRLRGGRSARSRKNRAAAAAVSAAEEAEAASPLLHPTICVEAANANGRSSPTSPPMGLNDDAPSHTNGQRRSRSLSAASAAAAAALEQSLQVADARAGAQARIAASFMSSAGDVTRFAPLSAGGASGGGIGIVHSGPSSLTAAPADATPASLSGRAATGGNGGGSLLSPLATAQTNNNNNNSMAANASFAALGTTLGNLGTMIASPLSATLVGAAGGGAASPSLSPPSPPRHMSAAAQLKLAVAKSIEAYARGVTERDGLTPVSNYAQLLWRDYELHWACVTQLKLILDYYVLLSVVLGWEGVRGRTAVMGLVSGLLSVYRVFVYGR